MFFSRVGHDLGLSYHAFQLIVTLRTVEAVPEGNPGRLIFGLGFNLFVLFKETAPLFNEINHFVEHVGHLVTIIAADVADGVVGLASAVRNLLLPSLLLLKLLDPHGVGGQKAVILPLSRADSRRAALRASPSVSPLHLNFQGRILAWFEVELVHETLFG